VKPKTWLGYSILIHEPLAFENDEMKFEVKIVEVRNEVGKLEARSTILTNYA
jgi:hypothetical protein